MSIKTTLDTLDSKLVDEYTSRWKKQRINLADSQKDEICKLYMSKILKIEDKTIEDFIQNERN